ETNPRYNLTNSDVFYLYGKKDEFYPLEKFQSFEQNLKKFAPNLHTKSYDTKHEITDEMRSDIRKWLTVNR
ncbi:MAG: hypothetical protein LC768_11880, partial [Acidobacteria bacterium]|nr:hypothetical protein [Acidobacteriota bacterium]MCA1639009.1 hypothetical protein [Acidobacteriota bacterium]